MLSFQPLRGLGDAYQDCIAVHGAGDPVCASADSDAGSAPAPPASSSDEMQFAPMNVGTNTASVPAGSMTTPESMWSSLTTSASGSGMSWPMILGAVALGAGLIFILGGGLPKKA